MTYLDEHIRDIVVNEPQVLEFPKLTGDSIVNNVVESFIERSNVGFAKYGTNLDRKDLSALEWINHLQQELQDGILYAEKLKEYLPAQSQSMMVIQEIDLSDNEAIVIAIASDRKNALKIIEEYYGKDYTMSNFRDIRDSGLDFTAEINFSGSPEVRYRIWGQDFNINVI